tara:strand:- start:72 stop:2747 length:2676 start_codon:yes stop_codon:yes gene_type:complete
MNDIYNRKMFVQGFNRGRRVSRYGLPAGAGQDSLGGALLGFDVLGGFNKAKDLRTEGITDPEGSYPFVAEGFKQVFSTVPEYYSQGYNQILAPFLDVAKLGLGEGIIGLGASRGDVSRSGLLDPAGRFETEANPYGLPVKPGLFGNPRENMIIAFDQEYPRGSEKRKAFIVDKAQEPGFSSKLAMYGVSQTEISALSDRIIEAVGPPDPQFETKDDFLKKPGSGYQAGENNLVKLLQGEAFKETSPGDLNVMQEIVDARKQSAQEDDVSEQEKQNLEGGTPNADPGSVDDEVDYVAELQGELRSAEDQRDAFNFEDEVDKLKKVLSEQTDVDDPTTPALLLLQLASNLISGKTSERGFTGFLDVLGQASQPVLDSAIKLSAAERARKQEIGASAVALALEKEKDLIEAAQAQADKILDLNEPFDETRFIHELRIGPNGEKLGYTDTLPIPVNSLAQAAPYLELQPFIVETEDGKTRTVSLPRFEMLKTDEPGEFLPGLRDPDGYYKSGGPHQLLQEILKNMSVAQSFTQNVLNDEESSFSLVGAPYLVQNFAFKAADIVDGFLNDKDLQARLGDDFSVAGVEKLKGQIQQIQSDDRYDQPQKDIMVQNLLLEASGYNYRNALVVKADELINAPINVGGQAFTLRELALAEPGTFDNQEVILEGATTDLMLKSGNTLRLEGDDIIREANEKINTIVRALDASQIGYNIQDGQYDIRPIDSFDDQSISMNVFGKNLKISNKISQVQTYSTLLAFGFAQTIQPDQRLLKDTIEKSLQNFSITDLTSGPKQVRGRVEAYQKLLEDSYNNIINNTFTDAYAPRYQYFDGKKSITQFKGNDAVTYAGSNQNNLNVNFNAQNTGANQSINTGQNNAAKDNYYNLTEFLNEVNAEALTQ